MAEHRNPFLYSRRESELETPLYVTGGREGFFDWISGQQYLFEGLRGSGKTSILKSMEWDTVWKVGPIRVEGTEEVKKFFSSQPSILAVRCRFEEMDTEYWKAWHKQVGQEWSQKYYGTYLEYLLLDLFLSALLRIRKKSPNIFECAESEDHLVHELIQLAFPYTDSRPRLPEQSLWALSHVVKDQHYGMRELVNSKASKEAMSNFYPVLSPGSLIQCFGESLITNYEKLSKMKVFPLLDDCNHLTDWQTQVINSAVSRAKNPISYKLTSVFGLYKNRTTIDGRPLGEQELKTIRISGAGELEWKHSRKYLRLVQGVCQTRIESAYNEELAQLFDFRKFFGAFDLQSLLEKTLSGSEKPKAILLLEQAKNDAERKGSRSSITSTWLNEKRVRELEQPSYENDAVQKMFLHRLDSMYTRKFNYTAAVAICQDLRLSFPYCGWSTILHLSNGSIREMLRIMYEIWEIMHLPIKRFVQEHNINWRKQKQAIKKAAENYLNGLDRKPLLEVKDKSRSGGETRGKNYPPSSLPSICVRLGRLFAQFQSHPSVCVEAETASLKVKRDDLESDIIKAIGFGVMTGMLLKVEDDSTISIGLHPFLSPIFNISFRSPFYSSESVEVGDLTTLFKGTDMEAKKASERIVANRMKRYQKQEKVSDIQMNFLEHLKKGDGQ